MKFTSILLGATTLFSAAHAAYTNTTDEPQLTGSYADGKLHFEVSIPTSLGPWGSVSIVQDGDIKFKWDGKGSFSVDGAAAPSDEFTDDTTESSLDAEYVAFPTDKKTLLYTSGLGSISGPGEYSLGVVVTLNDVSSKLFKRADSKQYKLSTTVTVPEDGGNGGVSTTTVTVTSCSDNVCTKTPVVTGVTVCTTTSNGVKTIYTTYCPLPTTEPKVATTVVTITSCSDHVCTKTPVTTGVTVCTTTSNGAKTTYTTWCPLPTTVAPKTTLATSQPYTPPAVSTASGVAAAVEVKGAAFGAAILAFAALM